jgi:beta-lactamase superfamily II metal-dependent hydrolase
MRRSSHALSRLLRRVFGVALVSLAVPAAAFAIAGNGKLQIHHIDVGQGDGALVISPNGQTALFDDGNYLSCTGIKNYLQGLGITTVDYHFLSHYHSDHLGCIDDLAAIGITIGTAGYDRGYSYSSGTYTAYVNTLGAKRHSMTKNQVITLDAGSGNPVTIKCVDLNGAGVYSPSGSDENAKSLDLLVSYGSFQEEIGGDLTGDPGSSNDVETTVGPEVGDVEVYKAHHHGSRYSNNDNWLNAVGAEVCVISCGDGNSYGHPTTEALTRMHNHSIHTYWTETGNGATPNGSWDKVAHGTIVIQAQPGQGASYTVTGPGINDTYYNGGSPPINTTQFATSLTMLKGSLATGDVTRLQVSDDSRIGVSAGTSAGSYWTDWYASVFLAHPPLNLTVTCETSFTISRTQSLYVYNWSSAAWDLVNTATVSTTDVTKTWSTSSPDNYVGPSREVRFRVLGSTNTGTYTSRGDFMSFNYDYAAGTAPMMVAGRAREDAGQPAMAAPALAMAVAANADAQGHVDALPGAPGSVVAIDREAAVLAAPQSVLERIEASRGVGGAQLVWAVAAGDHVDGFNVYRENLDGALVFAGYEADIAIEGRDAVFRFTDPAGAEGGVYWLGTRACSGPEALVGPIRVEASAGATRLDLGVSPNPAAGSTRFEFALERGADVTLEVFDLQGRKVATPMSGHFAAGAVRADWNLRDGAGKAVEPGLYFARLQTLGRTLYTRVTVVAR